MALGYLVQPFIQVQDINGTPVVGARVYVYEADTTDFAVTYRDFEGHRNQNPIITDELGNFTVVADSEMMYDMVINDADDNLLFSKKQLSVNFAGADGSFDIQAGTGISIGQSGNTYVINVDTSVIATQEDLAAKQDRLSSGANISLEDNTVSVVGRKELVCQFPVKIGVSGLDQVKIYLDEDFVRDIDIVAGTDIKITENSGGQKVISVDTDSTATGTQNFVANHGNTATGNYNAVFGTLNVATGNQHFLAGNSNTITGGERNVAFGAGNTGSGYSNTVGGIRNTVAGSSMVVIGLTNVADGAGCAVFGANNVVSGNYSLIGGEGNPVTGNRNITNGYRNSVDGNSCAAFGRNNSVHGTASIVCGEGLELSDSFAAAFGQYNTVTGNTRFAVGNGTSILAGDRLTTFCVMDDNNIFYRFNGGMVQLKPHGSTYTAIVGPGEERKVTLSDSNVSDGYVDLVYGISGAFADNVSSPVKFEYTYDAMYLQGALSSRVSSIEFYLYTDGETNYWKAFTNSAPVHQQYHDWNMLAYTQHRAFNRLRVRLKLGVAATAGDEIYFYGGGFVTAEVK